VGLWMLCCCGCNSFWCEMCWLLASILVILLVWLFCLCLVVSYLLLLCLIVVLLYLLLVVDSCLWFGYSFIVFIVIFSGI